MFADDPSTTSEAEFETSDIENTHTDDAVQQYVAIYWLVTPMMLPTGGQVTGADNSES